MMRSLSFILLLVLATCGFSEVARAQADAPDAAAKAQLLFEKGRRAIVNNKFKDAYEPLRQAWELRQTYDVAGLLGQTEYELNKYRDAAEHLAFSIRTYPAKEGEAPKKRLEGWLADAKKHVGTVTIAVNKSGAEILVDGASSGRSPLADPIFVEPGERTIEARLDGHEPASERVVAEAGSVHEVRFDLVEKPGAVVLPPSGLDDPPPAGSGNDPQANGGGARSSLKPAIVIGGAALTAVALGVGIGFGVDHASAKSDANELSDKLGNDGCSRDPNDPNCRKLSDAVDREERSGQIATIGFVAAGIFGVATLSTYLLWSEDKAHGPPPAAVGLAHLPGAGAAIQVSGAF